MRDPNTEVELLPSGMENDAPEKGAFVQNMYVRKGAWEVRAGFGQMAQFDSTLGMPGDPTVTKQYTRHMGSRAMRTDFGHTQIVSVFTGFVFSGDVVGASGTWSNRYFVSIYDVTTDRRWEEVLHVHTSENDGAVVPMEFWRPQYNTNFDEGYETWVNSDADEDTVFFTEFQDNLFFGSNRMGLWAYQPADFDQTRNQQIDYVRRSSYGLVYGESSKVIRVSPEDGQFSARYAYLDSASFPSPTDAAVIDNRLAIADGRDIYFSDIGKPNAIIGVNVLPVPCDQTIVAVAEVGGSLMIWTPSEAWLYEPNVGATVSGGRLTRVSQTVGCLGPAAKVRANDVLVWADKRGIHATSGGLSFNTVSDDIDAIFDEGLSNPLSNYYQDNGATTLASPQPQSFYTWEDRQDVHMAYDPLQGILFIGMPNQRVALTLQGTSWALWNFESIVSSVITTVVADTIPNPWLVALDGGVWCIGAVETYTPDDQATDPENVPTNSYFILEWGRGGALDRSVEVEEDNRHFSGYFEDSGLNPSEHLFVIGKPVQMPAGYVLPRGTTPANDVWLVPIYLAPADATGLVIDRYELRFAWDTVQWAAVRIPGTPELDFVLPAERDTARGGFGYGAPTNAAAGAGSAAIQVLNINTGLPHLAGTLMDVAWNGPNAVANPPAPSFGNAANMAGQHLNPIAWLPFTKVTAANTTMSMNIVPVYADHTQIAVGSTACNVYVWHSAAVGDRHDDDDVAQPVDWVLKTSQVGNKQGWQILARTMYANMITHGKATTRLVPTWIHGLLNFSLSSDSKGWSAQIVDYAGDITKDEKTPLRARFRDSSGGMQGRVFDDGGARGPAWGSSLDSTEGDFLVDDEQHDTVAMSSRVRGQRVSYMLFGHMANRAERIVINSMRAVIRKVGGRRRRGR